ncbi:MAG TPA: DinB family protein [Gemmatimonadaceae bacterium]|nr:DinB family protein [Gemmatimonadaceae bacterium]
MTDRMRWFSRKFAFDVEPWAFPNLLERVRGTPARLEERLRALDTPTLTTRVSDQWSIQENAGHMLDLEPLWATRFDDFERGADRLSAADLENRKTHDANHNATSLESILAGFRRARAEIVTRLERYDEAMTTRTSRHPRLDQPMRVIDLTLFVAEHDDHHLATMSVLLRELRSRTRS